jgi:hypothetical protein
VNLRFVGVSIHLFTKQARTVFQDRLNVVVEHVSELVEHHVVARAVQLFKAQVSRIFIENLLDRICQFLPGPAQFPSSVNRNDELDKNTRAKVSASTREIWPEGAQGTK